MRMHICIHGQQPGGKEIDQKAIFLCRLVLQMIYLTLKKPQ